MNILLVRHGESEDDLINAYGGWADFPLTKEGKQQILRTAKKIQKLKVSFDKAYTSPLKRAVETGSIIAKQLKLNTEEILYVKERNTYGLLCGVNKDIAKVQYPQMVKALEEGNYVLGQEREEDINERAKVAWKKLTELPEENIIVVTHGNFLKALMPIALKKKLVKKEDGGFILLKISSEKISVEVEEGIEVE